YDIEGTGDIDEAVEIDNTDEIDEFGEFVEIYENAEKETSEINAARILIDE
ncbi:24374_t:CDS:1, partial [Dentiscutata erythropus]